MTSMYRVKIIPEMDTDVDEFIKSICFVSPDIQNVVRTEEGIEIEISDAGKAMEIRAMLVGIMKKYTIPNKNRETYYENYLNDRRFYDISTLENDVIFFDNGQIGFGEKGKFLFDFLDSEFSEIAYELGAVEKLYPVLLPLDDYSMTGYVRKTPQYAIFCSTVNESLKDLEQTDVAIHDKKVKEIIKEPRFALSPSACFHTYIEYKDKTLKDNTIVTFRQNVFRNEGRLNYNEIGRLCDYHVREIVMIGSNEFILESRNKIMQKSKELMSKLQLIGDISIASDSFVVPKMQMYRKIQHIDKSKYEMHLNISPDKSISTASYNLHGKAFTDPFNISVENCEDTVTACVGFGLQRWVLAFLLQHGLNEESWPEKVKSEYFTNKKNYRIKKRKL